MVAWNRFGARSVPGQEGPAEAQLMDRRITTEIRFNGPGR